MNQVIPAFLKDVIPQDTKPYPFTQLQTDWLNALRSGKYKQGQGYLRDAQNGYCCLGVLCELAGYEASIESIMPKCYTYKGADVDYGLCTSYLPPSLVNLGLFRNSLGAFSKEVKFANVNYGKETSAEFQLEHKPVRGHSSLGSMNDGRVIKTEDGGMRAFSFNEIADYIEFDPWNVFLEPTIEG